MGQVARDEIKYNAADKVDKSNGSTVDISDESDIVAPWFCDGEEGADGSLEEDTEDESLEEDTEDESIGLDGDPTDDYKIGWYRTRIGWYEIRMYAWGWWST